MALGALAQNTNVAVVPVGMNYFHAHKFRSRAVVEFGEPVMISPELVDKFKQGKRRQSVGDLLSAIYQSLAAVTMTAPDFDTLMVRIAPLLFSYACRSLP
jgi:glycerol-3-phosphate O-acyltransferase/dihydroxyacetone phosphate acyltransferase